MIEHALELYELGFSIIPLGTVDETPPNYFIEQRCDGNLQEAKRKWPKAARYKWKQAQTTPATREEIEHWWSLHPEANIAVVTGINLFVVDADSEASIAWVEDKNITVTPWRVNTSKGRHYYYQMSPGLNPHNSVNTITKIDTRGVGGYVVAAGSIHSSGKQYEWDKLPGWDCDSISELPVITQEDLDKLAAYNGTPVPLPSGERVYGDMRGVRLAHDGSSVPDGKRNDAATSMAGSYFRQGMSLVQTVNLLKQWNQNNQPPMSDGELETTVASVASTATNNGQQILMAPPPGKIELPKPVVDPGTGQQFVPSQYVTESESRTKALLSRIRSDGNLMASPPPKVENFWGTDLLYRGSRMIIGGDAKIGKSRYALALAKSAATGTKFLDWMFHKPLRVLWLQAEIDEGHLHQRVTQVRSGCTQAELGLLNNNLLVSDELEMDVFDDYDLASLHGSLEKLHVDILIVDPICNFSTMNENDAKEVNRFLRVFDRIKREFKCAVILVHHNKKRQVKADASIDDLRGSTAFRGWADSSIILSGTANSTNLMWDLRHTILNHGDISWSQEEGTYHFCQPAFSSQPADVQREARVEQLRFVVRSILDHAPGRSMARDELSLAAERQNAGLATGGALREFLANVGLGLETGFESAENLIKLN